GYEPSFEPAPLIGEHRGGQGDDQADPHRDQRDIDVLDQARGQLRAPVLGHPVPAERGVRRTRPGTEIRDRRPAARGRGWGRGRAGAGCRERAHRAPSLAAASGSAAPATSLRCSRVTAPSDAPSSPVTASTFALLVNSTDSATRALVSAVTVGASAGTRVARRATQQAPSPP